MPDISNELSRALVLLQVANAEYHSCDQADCTDQLKLVRRRLEHAIDLLKAKKRPIWNKTPPSRARSSSSLVDNGDRSGGP